MASKLQSYEPITGGIMLRLTLMAQGPTEAVVAVDGWITGEEVGLLEREGERWLQEVSHLVLDLNGVRFIDQTGIELLKRWSAAEKLALHGGALFVQSLLQAHGLTSAISSEAHDN